MGAINKRGIWVPAAGDGLLEAWATMAKQMGNYISVASTAAASAVLDAALAAGMGATTSNPMLFLIGGTVDRVAYLADGSKTGSGKWALSPVSQTFTKDNTYETPWSGLQTFSVAAGGYSNMMTSSLEAAPYDRRVIAHATVYGKRLSGTPRLRLKVHDNRVYYGTFDADGATATAGPLSFIIPANAAPSITAGLFGGGSVASSVQLSGEENQSALMVTAFPYGMGI